MDNKQIVHIYFLWLILYILNILSLNKIILQRCYISRSIIYEKSLLLNEILYSKNANCTDCRRICQQVRYNDVTKFSE